MSTQQLPLLSPEEFKAALFAIGKERYHHRHPFHLLMHEGKLHRGQLQAWVLNRYYYQSRIPIKDAIILSRSNDARFRRSWRERIIEHDGEHDGEHNGGHASDGGISRWLELAEATGLTRERVIGEHEVLPIVRYSVQAYLELVRSGSMVQAVASSLTELFAGELITLRIGKLREHYPWLAHGLSYFEKRISQAPQEAEFAFRWVVENARTREQQEEALNALRAKCDLLWAQLDAIHFAYVDPGWPPPDALRMEP
ncbi:MAG TPA: pyrroloquinoline-quinone synthase PqqC [Candidatus Saccharimonadales bacterium]|jgi:coenzyme PQQ biosynthesis protein C|nr:pyrroloquinoline-quinone synthase PqqC [Candidatus Saccharimonadales bacterium]